MPELTRRRSTGAREECWHVYYGDIHAGTIVIRTGNPHVEDPWEWHCGFYPGSQPGEQQNGTAATFDEARADFESAWRVFLSKRTEADFQAWRDQRDWTAQKYAMWEAGERLPSQKPSSMMRCPCGEMFDSHRLENTLITSPTSPPSTKPVKFAEPRPFSDPEAAVRKLIEIANAAGQWPLSRRRRQSGRIPRRRRWRDREGLAVAARIRDLRQIPAPSCSPDEMPSLMPDKGWRRHFEEPIPLPDEMAATAAAGLLSRFPVAARSAGTRA